VVTIELDHDRVMIKPKGWSQIWAFKRALSVHPAHIRSVGRATPVLRPRGMRLPGTYLPGVIVAGTYRSRAGREFWDTRLNGKAIVIDLTGGPYTRLVVDVADPDAVLRQLQPFSV
jgi:hypothetical protein